MPDFPEKLFPEFDIRHNPTDTLFKFMRALEDFLGKLVTDNADAAGQPLFDEAFLPGLRDAWRETKPALDLLASASRGIPVELVKAYGLGGTSLRLKLQLINHLYALFRTDGKKVLDRLLTAIDILLGGATEASKLSASLTVGSAAHAFNRTVKSLVAGA